MERIPRQGIEETKIFRRTELLRDGAAPQQPVICNRCDGQLQARENFRRGRQSPAQRARSELWKAGEICPEVSCFYFFVHVKSITDIRIKDMSNRHKKKIIYLQFLF